MKESKDEIIQEDIEALVNTFDKKFDILNDKTVFVTGASGLIGSLLVRTLLCMNRVKNTNVNVIAQVRNKEAFMNTFNKDYKSDKLEIYEGDVVNNINIDKDIDYIVHLACPTSSPYFVSNPVETIDTIVLGTKNILELAKRKKVKSVLYSSSLEVYGVTEKNPITESDYGYIDILNTRSSYSMGKRMAELLCYSYFKEYDVPVRITRLTQTFGPGVLYNDKRVFAEFARCVIEKKDIVLHTEGLTKRSYLYLRDAVNALLYALLFGVPGEAYNVANKNTAITIRDMAEYVCKLFPESNINVKIEILEDISSFGYNPTMTVLLDTSKIEELGWESTADLDVCFKNLVRSMKNN